MIPDQWGYIVAAYGIAWGVFLLYTWNLNRAMAASRPRVAKGEEAQGAA